MFHRDRWTPCAQIEFGFNCTVAFIIYLLHGFCLQVDGGPEMHVLLLFCSPSFPSSSPPPPPPQLMLIVCARASCVRDRRRVGEILFHPPLQRDKGHCNSPRVWCSLPWQFALRGECSVSEIVSPPPPHHSFFFSNIHLNGKRLQM